MFFISDVLAMLNTIKTKALGELDSKNGRSAANEWRGPAKRARRESNLVKHLLRVISSTTKTFLSYYIEWYFIRLVLFAFKFERSFFYSPFFLAFLPTALLTASIAVVLLRSFISSHWKIHLVFSFAYQRWYFSFKYPSFFLFSFFLFDPVQRVFFFLSF